MAAMMKDGNRRIRIRTLSRGTPSSRFSIRRLEACTPSGARSSISRSTSKRGSAAICMRNMAYSRPPSSMQVSSMGAMVVSITRTMSLPSPAASISPISARRLESMSLIRSAKTARISASLLPKW